MDSHIPQSQTLTTVTESPVEEELPHPPSVEYNSKISMSVEVNKENKVDEVQKSVLNSASEQTSILNDRKTPDKGPKKRPKINLQMTKEKPCEICRWC